MDANVVCHPAIFSDAFDWVGTYNAELQPLDFNLIMKEDCILLLVVYLVSRKYSPAGCGITTTF